MQTIRRHFDPNLLAILNLLAVISSLGFLYCLIVLLHGGYVIEITAITFYTLWFAICWLSVTIMKQGDIFGAYALGIAIIAITIYELLHGVATIGGAVSGTIVMLIVITYIQASTADDNSRETRLTN